MNEFDGDEIPVGWELVTLTEAERDDLCAAAEAGDHDTAEAIVDCKVYTLLFTFHFSEKHTLKSY